jgi:type IV pilus assembly protein PilC
MPEFHYSARNEQGKRFAGSIEAETQTEALQALSEQYAIVTRLERKAKKNLLTPLFSGVKGEDLLGFSQTLAAMLDGGITVKRALDTIYGDTESRALRMIIMDCSAQIGGGAPLSNAMAGHPSVFGPFFVKMVRAGESSGELPEMLRRVSEYIEKTESLKDKVKSALTYPFVVICFALLLMAGILAFGIPYLKNLYDGLNLQLPVPTQIMVAIGTFMNDNLLLFAGLVLLAMYLGKSWLAHPRGIRQVDYLKLHLPVLGDFFRTLYTARFARTLALLYSSGVPLLGALQMTGESVGNVLVTETVEKTQQAIEDGDSLSDCLRVNPYFLDAAIGMVAAGEESGKLDHMLKKVADFYEHKVYTKLEGLTSTIEPLIMIVVGIMIGIMIMTLGLPFMSLASAF